MPDSFLHPLPSQRAGCRCLLRLPALGGFPGGTVVKNPPVSGGDARDLGSIPGLENPLEEEMATHANIIAWRISWAVELCGLQSMGSHRVRHD